MVELLFLPSVFAPCSTCHGSRYNPQTLEVEWNGRNIAQVLELTVDDACDFFAGEASVMRSLDVLREIGLGYLRLGQPATELSGGEAQRIKLATELQRAQRGNTIYILDEPTSGLHPSDADRLMQHLQGLVDAGNIRPSCVKPVSGPISPSTVTPSVWRVSASSASRLDRQCPARGRHPTNPGNSRARHRLAAGHRSAGHRQTQ